MTVSPAALPRFAWTTLVECDRPVVLQVMVNEEVDPTLVIKRLKQEIRDLKDEIRSVGSLVTGHYAWTVRIDQSIMLLTLRMSFCRARAPDGA